MASSLILIALAIVGAFSLFVIARRHRSQVTDPNQLTASIRPVDLQAFENLTSPGEEHFLMKNLSSQTYRRVQRRRLLAAIAYVHAVAANAVILMRIGQLAQNSSDAEIVTAGRELGEAASRLRVYALVVLAKLCVGVLVPGNRLSPGGLAKQYEELCYCVRRLSRLRVAGGAPRLTVML